MEDETEKRDYPENLFHHVPVMAKEVLAFLEPKPGDVFVDCTLGGAGHARLLAEKIAPHGTFIGIDRDIEAIQHAKRVLTPYLLNIHLFHGDFSQLPACLKNLNLSQVDCILADLGISSDQIRCSGRGFSFQKDEPLDMRMDTRSSLRAEDLVNNWSEKDLEQVFREFGEEPRARQIAREIGKARARNPIQNSLQLANIVVRTVRRSGKSSASRSCSFERIHPATRVFMALRIAVNQELDQVSALMDRAPNLLSSGGRLCVISFHSLEDRIVKHRIKALEKPCQCPPEAIRCTCNRKPRFRNLTRKVVKPEPDEVLSNPLARSARLRAVQRIVNPDNKVNSAIVHMG